MIKKLFLAFIFLANSQTQTMWSSKTLNPAAKIATHKALSKARFLHCHNLLEIPEDATKREIKTAYRKKSLQAHPDTGGSRKAFIELKKAKTEALDFKPSLYHCWWDKDYKESQKEAEPAEKEEKSYDYDEKLIWEMMKDIFNSEDQYSASYIKKKKEKQQARKEALESKPSYIKTREDEEWWNENYKHVQEAIENVNPDGEKLQ